MQIYVFLLFFFFRFLRFFVLVIASIFRIFMFRDTFKFKISSVRDFFFPYL